MNRAWKGIALGVVLSAVAVAVSWAIAQPNSKTDSNAKVTAYAAEDSNGLRPVILDFINSADEALSIAVAWLSDDAIEQALADAQNRGARVLVLVRNATSNADDCEDYVDSVREVLHMNQLHDKFAVTGDRVLTGSVNWTESSISEPNNVVVIESETIAAHYRHRFGELLEDSKTSSGCPERQ